MKHFPICVLAWKSRLQPVPARGLTGGAIGIGFKSVLAAVFGGIFGLYLLQYLLG